jgi:hypothetical protein
MSKLIPRSTSFVPNDLRTFSQRRIGAPVEAGEGICAFKI